MGQVNDQRAENGGLDLSWLDLALLGRPDFQSRGPKILILKENGPSEMTSLYIPGAFNQSDLQSVTLLAGHAKFAPHMGDPHGDPQTSPQHADPRGLGAFSKKSIQEIHVDRRVVG